MPRIGIFPLQIVLFPGSSYPLHIYENRYRALIRESLDSNTEFGINLVEESKLFDVGCMARVSSVLQEYEDGRMDIIVTGTERFRGASYRQDEKPYMTAEAEIITDTDPVPESELLEETIALYNQLVESVYGGAEEELDPTHWTGGGASFRIAQKSGLDLVVRQNLLEMRSETARLTFLHSYLRDLVPKVKAMERIQLLIRNDGYITE